MNSNNEEEKKMRIHHIGYFVPKIKNALECFKHLGFHAESEIIYDNERGINVIFMYALNIQVLIVELQSLMLMKISLKLKFIVMEKN